MGFIEATLETVEVCPLCGGTDAEFLTETKDRLHGLPGTFALVSCHRCSLVRLSPRPTAESLPHYYPDEDYYSYQVEDGDSHLERHGVKWFIRSSVLSGLGYEKISASRLKRLLSPFLSLMFFGRATYGYGKRLPRFVEGGKALDVGCGSGKFLNLLKFLGWDVKGIEMSTTAAETAKSKFGIQVFSGELAACPFEKESFDFINISHVIEHLKNPVEDMKVIAGLLKPTGVMYVETPNILGAVNADGLRYWFPTDSPRHLFLFSPKVLREVLTSVGLAVDNILFSHVEFAEWEYLYKLEEAEGKLDLNLRGAIHKLRHAVRMRKLRNRLLYFFNKSRGNTIQCWIRPAARPE